LTTYLAVLAAGWGVAMALAPLLQIRTIRRTGSSQDVSLGWLGVLLVGFGLWFAYGVAIANPALIVPNTVAAVVCVATIAVVRQYR
jgi:LPXTG-motif cell wall-anchored protein